jgi:hypothetical protein
MKKVLIDVGRRRKGGRAKPARTEIVSLRLDPALRWAAEIAAHIQRRTLSSFIERALEEAIKEVEVPPGKHRAPGDEKHTVNDVLAETWDIAEAERFLNLAFAYPQLLTLTEQRLFRLIRDNDAVWRCPPGSLRKNLDQIDWPRLREHWETFKAVALDELPASALPTAGEREHLAGPSGT